MAVVSTTSNHFKYQLGKKLIDLSTDTLKAVLMNSAFAFDKDAHANLAAITEDIWEASTVYTADDIVIPTTPNGHKYICTTGGTSDATEPASWPSTSTQADGSVVWTRTADDDQLPTANGYTQNSHTFTTPSWTEDDTNDKGAFTCDNLTITADATTDATGIGPVGSYCIYDDTTADDTIICCVDFGTDYTVNDGSSIQLQNVAISVA